MNFAPAPASKFVLGDKDVNTAITSGTVASKDGVKDIKSMEYHRQVLQSKMEAEGYVSICFFFFFNFLSRSPFPILFSYLPTTFHQLTDPAPSSTSRRPTTS